MLERKILRFPVPIIERGEQSGCNKKIGEQLDLFAGEYTDTAAIAFINIEIINQNALLNSLVKNSIKTIIDLRDRAIFPKPRFDHKYIMGYFYNKSIDYIELAMLRTPSLEICLFEPSKNHHTRWASICNYSGITACIFDEAAIKSGTVASFRNYVTKEDKDLIEIHPRFLV